MIYALGILSLVNLLLGLIPSGEEAKLRDAEAEVAADVPRELRSVSLADIVVGAINKLGEKYE